MSRWSLFRRKSSGQIIGPTPTSETDSSEAIVDHDGESLGDKNRVENGKKQIMMSILKQIAKGTPVYRCQLPIFVIEPRSLLERLSDFASFSYLLDDINLMSTPEQRFLAILRFYLSSWHLRPKEVRSNYNPILGETFHCSFGLKDSEITFIAEQTSHHPPCSAFFLLDKQKKMYLQSSIRPNTKFSGNSVEVSLDGMLTGGLIATNEFYEMTYPKYIIRGILMGSLSLEISGKTYLHCKQSGLSAEIEFHNKKAPNSVLGSVKTADGRTLYSFGGRWDQAVLIANAHESKTQTLIDVTAMRALPKIVPPIEQQPINESRRVWFDVTSAIQAGNEDAAFKAKSAIEERQRRENKSPNPQYFTTNSDGTIRFAYLDQIIEEMTTTPAPAALLNASN
eukprot:TRINITY_DN6371_c0_g1_i1.p1 TRINITY_DN6371_c0_g1~~TRINITY_DN6371_c0_g1_i1.p1  ORF type:complete len:395 (+),score=88.32 TRINITY_DN6371_c0_g1_i1:1390-2574(+)